MAGRWGIFNEINIGMNGSQYIHSNLLSENFFSFHKDVKRIFL